MNNILAILELLSRYGIIDIIFGLGVTGIIYSAFRRRAVKELRGIEITTKFKYDSYKDYKSRLNIFIKNNSGEPFFIYRILFRPIKNASKILKTEVTSVIHPDTCITPNGWYHVPIENDGDNDSDLPILMKSNIQNQWITFYIPFADEISEHPNLTKYFETIRENHKCGLLFMQCIYKGEQKTLKTKL